MRYYALPTKTYKYYEKDTCYNTMIDLHLHLDGSMPIDTARKLAAEQGIPVPATREELRQVMSVMRDCKDLNDYLARFQLACSLLHVREAISECIHDLMEELHQQGLQYAEVRFAPQKSCLQGLTQYEVTEIALQALKDSPIPCGLILSMMRGDDTHEANKETIEVAKAFHGKGVVAIDLAGSESLYPTHNFVEEFALVREAGMPLIVHAGEAAGAESVREAVEAGAVRIGHGVRSLEDPEVVQLLVDKRVMLELCPTSNLQTGIFPSYEAYPIRQLMEAGVRVCVNTDNMTVSDTTLAKEWQHLIEAAQLTKEEVRAILLDTIDATFAPEKTKEQLRKAVP